MKLRRIIGDVEVLAHRGDLDVEISDIFYDSRAVARGGLFVAIKGLVTDGHGYVGAAVDRGAAAVVVEDDVDIPGAVLVRVRDSRAALGRLADAFFDYPSMKLKLLGVTGTNGKTTICYIVEEILAAAGKAPGVIGTINYRYGKTSITPPHTTPESLDLVRLLSDMVDAGTDHTVMEVSSHALDLRRVDCCMFDAALFTNLTQDHLDYHQTMENYFESKARFFRELINRNKETTSVINADDPWGKRLIDETRGRLMTYGLSDGADIRPTAFTADTRGVRGEGVTPYGKFRFESNLLGRYNIYNLLAALGGALGMGIDLETAVSGINRRIVVPGRLEPVEGTGDVSVLVDYAHTDDALTNVLSTLAPLAKGRLITVFGCGGDRDRKKRPKMAAAAAARSHKVIVTSDNPRTEDPAAIIEEVLAGFEGTDYSRVDPGGSFWQDSRKVYAVIPDRREAIRFAVSRAEGGDIVLLAGKGHEDYQIIGTTKYPFDDRIEAKEALTERRRHG
jgi:UDP-N-acetylmuramoyl-L-alanyl-D-glutamate--2,6-diaminopimelate ligase